MTRTIRLRNWLTAAAAGALLQACASAPKVAPAPTPEPAPLPAVAAPAPAPAASPFQATPDLAPRDRVMKILTLLNDGQRDQARAEAVELLKQEPGNMLAQSLFDQIDKDPKLLLGEMNFPYRMQPGDSLSILAQRFLGDRFLFYALARYNNIDKPGAAEVGQTILIPGVPNRIPPRAARPARPESDEAAIDARLKRNAPAPTPPTAPARPVRDPARAAALRGQALAALNGGAADRAVSLLRQASALDPGSAPIQRDLVRAERILAAMHR